MWCVIFYLSTQRWQITKKPGIQVIDHVKVQGLTVPKYGPLGPKRTCAQTMF